MPNPVYTYTLDMICKHKSTKLNGSMYCYVSLTIQLKHPSFVYVQLNDQTIQFCISNLFALNLNVKQFYLTLSCATTQGQSEHERDR